MKIAFVLPTKNERGTIAGVIGGLETFCRSRGWGHECVVVDDSEDDTAKIAREAGARVLCGGRVGLGQAMLRGLAFARGLEPDWIVSLDADGQVDLDDLEAAFTAGAGADVVLSSRFLEGASFEYIYPRLNWIGNRILVGILRLATFRAYTDSHGGIRLLRPHTLDGLILVGRHTYVQETLIQLHRRGFTIVEVPGRWKARGAGESRVLRSIRRYVCRTLPALLYLLGAHFLFLTMTAGLVTSVLLGWAPPAGLLAATLFAAAAGWLIYLRCQALRIT